MRAASIVDAAADDHGVAPFAARIVAWQRRYGRQHLPWQQTRDPYRVWLSEIMLQQTQVATALPYYERFVAAFPDVHALAAAPLERVLEHWSGLGYYRRAHHLHAAARAVVTTYGGAFPREATLLEALPGIGRSTAAAIAAFAFGARAPILDGNVKRVLARHRGIEGYPGAPKVELALWAAAAALVPDRDIEAYTQGMMDLGAGVCMRVARCAACPVAEDCMALAAGRVHELPSPRPSRPVRHRATRVLVIEHRGELLFEQRPPTGVWSGLWSLPELPLEADLMSALRPRFGTQIATGETLAPIAHAFTHFTLTMHPQRIVLEKALPRAESPGEQWLTHDAALGAALPAPIKRLVRELAVGGQGNLFSRSAEERG